MSALFRACRLEHVLRPGAILGWLLVLEGAGKVQAQTVVPDGTTVTTRIGNGPNTASGATVTLGANARVTVGNSNAISLGDGAVITLGANSVVTNNASNAAGLWSAGPNAVEFGSNSRLTIGVGASITALGTSNNGESVNVMGVGNVITNFGTLSSRSGAAIWFEDRVTGGTNTIDNYGIIQTQLGANANVIGNQRDGAVTFVNRTGGRIEGSLSFAAGDDQLTLEAGSVITGSFNGGGGTNTLTLGGAAGSADSLSGDIRNFQTLTKAGEGRWTLTGAIGANGGNAALQVLVNQGTLALTGNNANFSGRITVNSAGVLEARAQSLPPSLIDNGLVRFTQDTAGTYSGVISGTGAVEKTLGGDLTLAGANSYSGGTRINSGTVFISSDANLGAASGGLILNGGSLGSIANVTTARATTLGPLGGGLNASTGTTLTHAGTIGGSGLLTKSGNGTAVLTGNNSYTGGTGIAGGVLQVAGDANLGAVGGSIAFAGGTLRTTANMATARATTIGVAGGTLETAVGTTLSYGGTISGSGGLTKSGGGSLLLTGTNTYAGGTRVTGGIIEIATDASLGAPTGGFTLDGGTLRITQSVTAARNTTLGPAGGTVQVVNGADVNYSGAIVGSGSYTKTGAGNIFLSGTGSFTGGMNVAEGSLFVNGNLSAVTGTTTVQNGAQLSGNGALGGSVVVNSGARLTAGARSGEPATLTLGSLTLGSGSNLFFNMVDTAVGGSLNDLINVNGNLVLDGRFDVLEQGQNLGAGVYRIINYTGTLTNNGLDIGSYATIDGTSTRDLTGFSVQTVVPGQVNLINTSGLSLNYWDGNAGPKNNGVINGGSGDWRHAGLQATFNWTDPNGMVNAPWADNEFAIFVGAPGTVTVMLDNGAVTTSGMQFGVNGYLVTGAPLTLVGSPDTPGESTLRVGDGTPVGTGMTATIGAPLIGGTLLRKTDAGTLILTGVNTYSGGTRIEGGAIQIASDAALGAAGGALTLDSGTLRTTADIATGRSTALAAGGGTFETAAATMLTLSGAITGPGALTHTGAGTLTLLADGSHAGGTTIAAGTLQLGNGGATGSVAGSVLDNGALVVNRSNQLVLGGAISGSGTLTQAGSGTTVLTADNSYTGATTISAGTLQLGNGGATGSVAGPIVDNATLAINRSNDFTMASVISGTGTLAHTGTGTTILTGNNSYTGATVISNGFLYVDGDQSAATGLTSVAGGARLGGAGIVGGSVVVADQGTLAPGSVPGNAATLTIGGDLTFSNTSILSYNVMQAGVAGGLLNDLTVVGGNLTLDGVVNILDFGQSLGSGIYRLINYSGALTDHGLAIGTYSPDGTTPGTPIDGFAVQTAVRGR